MEPLTASVIVTLAFTKIFEKTTEKFTEAALAKMDELRKKIFNKFRGNEPRERAFKAAETGSKKDLEAVTSFLGASMYEDPAFAKEIQALAKEIKEGEKQDNSIMNQNNYGNSTGYQNKISGGEVFQGTNTINKYSNPN
jgi:hypothetical protein